MSARRARKSGVTARLSVDGGRRVRVAAGLRLTRDHDLIRIDRIELGEFPLTLTLEQARGLRDAVTAVSDLSCSVRGCKEPYAYGFVATTGPRCRQREYLLCEKHGKPLDLERGARCRRALAREEAENARSEARENAAMLAALKRVGARPRKRCR